MVNKNNNQPENGDNNRRAREENNQRAQGEDEIDFEAVVRRLGEMAEQEGVDIGVLAEELLVDIADYYNIPRL
eukprot:m.101635 g.101635  ORF g.101635 m.101635 type:complete len:73 (+) comp15178_c0_seq3:1094-1312(+)